MPKPADVGIPPIIYLDTCIHSALVREPDIRRRLTCLIGDLGGAGVGLSDTNILELHGATNLQRDLVELLLQYPTALLKLHDVIVAEEVAAYPHPRTGPIHTACLRDPDADVDTHPLLAMFRDSRIATAASKRRRLAAEAPNRHAALRDNFPPAQSGRYERHQADEFANLIAIQWIVSAHTSFVQSIVGPLDSSIFKSIRMYAYLDFWRYYLGRRTPNATSDLGDLAHALFYPYCRAIIVEVDAANTLRQIAQHSDLLDGVDILSLRDLRCYGDG
jgi:hypothetical protein